MKYYALVRELFLEQVEYRELLLQIVTRDMLLRYKQTVMGFGWALFMPILNTVIFSLIFMRVAPIATPIPYPLFAFAGLLIWNFFAASLRFSLGSLTSNSTLVTKVYFPREIFPFSAIVVSLIDLCVGGAGLVVLMVYYRTAPPPSALLLVPAVLAVLVVFAAAISLLLAMANLFYRDVKYLFDVVIGAWMFVTSVLYPPTLMGGVFGEVVRLNPMSIVIDAFRAALFGGAFPTGPFAAVSAFAAIFLMGVWATFHRAEFQFAERI